METTGVGLKKGTGFFDLPVEIRMEIYRLCVPTGFVFDIRETPTFRGDPWMSSSPGALSNRPPANLMCQHDFTWPVEPWADGWSLACRKDEKIEIGNDQNLPKNDDLKTRQKEYLRQRTEMWGEAESSVDKTQNDWETESGEDDQGELEHDDDEDNDSESNDSEGDDSDDSDGDSDGDSDRDSEDGDSEDDDSGEYSFESFDLAQAHFLEHLSGIPIDKWVDACFPTPIWMLNIQSLLITSRQIREEVLDILYGENVFRVAVGKHSCERALRNGFSKAKVQRMRHIMLLYEQFSSLSGDGPEFRLDRNIWDKVLPNLGTLRIVACQPKVESFVHREACRRSVAEMQRVWMKEVPPVMTYLGRTLSPSATVLVDIDMWKITSDLINKSLGRDWAHVRTTTGDTYFQRPSDLHQYDEWTDEIFDDAPTDCDCVPYEDSQFDEDWDLDYDSDYNPDTAPENYFYLPRWTE